MIVSANYIEITEAEALARPYADAWKDASIPKQQLALTDAELDRWRQGEKIAPFDALREAMRGLKGDFVLEVGCGVGHNASAIPDWLYIGVDYSEDFIQVAKARRPAQMFKVMDACMLDYSDKTFDTVISGCCILHIVDWRKAIGEACRVAKTYVILHRTPLSDEPTRYFLKKAYGVECVELHFNRAEVIEEMRLHDFSFRQEFAVTPEQSTLVFERALFYHPV